MMNKSDCRSLSLKEVKIKERLQGNLLVHTLRDTVRPKWLTNYFKHILYYIVEIVFLRPKEIDIIKIYKIGTNRQLLKTKRLRKSMDKFQTKVKGAV